MELATLSFFQSFGIYFSFLIPCILLFTFLVFIPGQSILTFFHLNNRPHGTALACFVGLLWATFLTLFAGMLGIFGKTFLIFYGLIHLGFAIRMKITLPAFRKWFNENFSYGIFVLLTCLLVSLVSMTHLMAWFDGEFTVGGGHLARTGNFFSNSPSNGQFVLVTLTAWISTFFDKMSPLNTITGWAPFFVPLVLLGPYELIQEVCPQSKKNGWKVLVAWAIVLPIVFRIPEIRGSIGGFGMLPWVFLYLFRFLYTNERSDLWGASITLGLAMIFSPPAGIFALLFVGSGGIIFGIFRAPAWGERIWQVLTLQFALFWHFVGMLFIWALGERATPLLAFLPGTIALGFSYAVMFFFRKILSRPIKKIPSSVVLVPGLISFWTAYAMNPPHDPVYNWFQFNEPVSFLFLNFLSYGFWGYLALACLGFSAFLLISNQKKFHDLKSLAFFIWAGMTFSFLFQIVCQLWIQSGFPFPGGRVFIWDLWKDSALYWGPLFFVPLMALVFGTIFRKQKWAVVTFAIILLPLQSLKPYLNLSHFNQFVADSFSPPLIFPWRGQQSFSILHYLAVSFNVPDDYSIGVPQQEKNCEYCAIYGYGFGQEEWPIIRFLLDQKLKKGEKFATSMSIRNADPYVNWIVRYEDGVNSVSPGLYWYLPSTTQFEPYQKRLRRIRKNRQGKPYSLSDPEKNLLWLKPQALPSGGLLARFSVPETKEYELYRGTDRQEFMPDILVDGKKFSPDSHRTGLPIGLLEAGKTHEIEVLPSPYESPLDGTLPMVLYPLRHWKLEQYFIEGSWKPSVSPFGIAMYTGVPTVPLTIEDLITIAETKDPKVRGNIFKKYGIRFFVSDYILRKVFPDMESLFARDPNLVRHGDRGLENTPVYEWRSP